MKNLKRVLSLGLASVMLLGMMVIGASAANTTDFTDADEIQNTEAVSTMAALNVINGKDNGSFDPTGNVTRGEMAKMITVMLNGGNEPTLSVNATSPKFTDIGGHWAQKYIEYCAAPNQGVVSGRGDGTFDPNGAVTGSEAAKMILTALNYHSDVFNFTGTDWEVNVNSRANAPEADLYEGLNIDPSKAINRDNAAQMLYNALDARMVTIVYDITSNGTTGKTYNLNGTKTFMEAKFGATKIEGVVSGNDIADLGATEEYDEGETVIEITNKTELTGTPFADETSLALPAASGIDVLGRTVTAYVKKNTRTNNLEVLGNLVVSNKNKVIISTDGTAVDDLLTKKKVDENSEDSQIGNLGYFENYGEAGETAWDVVAGDTVMLISNDGNAKTIEAIFVVKYTMGKVTKVNTKSDPKKITINAKNILTESADVGSQNFEDVIGVEGLDVDDYVLVTPIKNKEGDTKFYVEKPEAVTGEMSAYRKVTIGSGDEAEVIVSSLTVEGEKYDVSRATIPSELQRPDDYTNLDNEATFYFDANGKIVAVGDVAEAIPNYAISWGGATGNKIDTGRIKMTLADGTTKIYTISEDSYLALTDATGATFGWVDDNDDDQTDNAVGVLVSYSFDDDGNVKLNWPATGKTNAATKAQTTTFTNGKTLVKLNNKSVATGTNTAFFYVTVKTVESALTVTKVEVKTGYKEATTVESTGTEALPGGAQAVRNSTDASSLAAAVAFVNANGASDKTKLGNHLFMVSQDRTYTNYVTASVYLAGSDELETIRLARKTGANENIDYKAKEGQVWYYQINSKGYYELLDPTDADAVGQSLVDAYKADETIGKTSSITVELGTDAGDGEEYFITDNTVIINYVDKSDVSAVLSGSVEAGGTITLIIDEDNWTVLMGVITAAADDDDDTPTPPTGDDDEEEEHTHNYQWTALTEVDGTHQIGEHKGTCDVEGCDAPTIYHEATATDNLNGCEIDH